jgi:hypothetical protein
VGGGAYRSIAAVGGHKSRRKGQQGRNPEKAPVSIPHGRNRSFESVWRAEQHKREERMGHIGNPGWDVLTS